MSTLAAPDPSTRKAIVRDRPYGVIVDRLFDRETSSLAERNMYRWLYRQFRAAASSFPSVIDGHPMHVPSLPFAARARIVKASFYVEEVTSDAIDLARCS